MCLMVSKRPFGDVGASDFGAMMNNRTPGNGKEPCRVSGFEDGQVPTNQSDQQRFPYCA